MSEQSEFVKQVMALNQEGMTSYVLELRQQLHEHAETIAKLRADLADATTQLEARHKWICFHCGFSTNEEHEAEGHFGERDDAEEFKPLCKWWQRMEGGERAQALQDSQEQLANERMENFSLDKQIGSLKSRIEQQEKIIATYNSGGFADADALAEKYLDVSAQLADAIAQRDAAVKGFAEFREFIHRVRGAADGDMSFEYDDEEIVSLLGREAHELLTKAEPPLSRIQKGEKGVNR